MSRSVFDLLIIYVTGDRKVVKNVSSYGHQTEGKMFYYDKNSHRSFIPVDSVMFFGREFDYDED